MYHLQRNEMYRLGDNAPKSYVVHRRLTNQRSVRLRTKSKSTVSIMQAKYDIAPYIKAKELRSKGSTVGHLSDKDLKELFILVSPNADFRNKFDSILAKIIENRCEMIELTKQRDELLPLLMNGQATVNAD